MEYIPSFRDGLYVDIKPSYLIHTMTDEELKAKKFGLPKVKKFPMPDAAHVKSAIKFFNYATPSQEQELADAILARMEEYGIDPDSLNVGDENRFKKYLEEKTSLKHHGILGQRWGIRRFQNEDGSRTNLGRKHERELDYKSSDKTSDKPSYKSSDKSSDKSSTSDSSEDMKKIRKINQSGFIKNSDGSYTIPRDHKFYRVGNSSIDFNKSGGLYMSDASTNDVHRYVKSLGPTLLGKILGTASYNVQGLSAKSDMKMASDDQHNKIVLDALAKDKKLYKTWNDSMYAMGIVDNKGNEFSQKQIAEMSKNPNSKYAKMIGYSVSSFYGDPNYTKETKNIYDRFRSNGFDAIPDSHDRMSGTSESATIVLNPNKIEQVSNTYITKDVMRQGKQIVKQAGKLSLDEALR